MNEEDFIELRHDVERLEDALAQDVKQIKSLKDDVRELLHLLGLLALFIQRPMSGMAEEKAAIEFDTQLRALLEKHGMER